MKLIGGSKTLPLPPPPPTLPAILEAYTFTGYAVGDERRRWLLSRSSAPTGGRQDVQRALAVEVAAGEDV